MKLIKGIKPIELNIKKGTIYSYEVTGNYIEITITDQTEITKLKSIGFKNA